MQKRNKLKCGSSYKDSNFIFTTESGNNIDVTNLSHVWEKILKNANLPHKKISYFKAHIRVIIQLRYINSKTVTDSNSA